MEVTIKFFCSLKIANSKFHWTMGEWITSNMFIICDKVYCPNLLKLKIFHQITQENPGSKNI